MLAESENNKASKAEYTNTQQDLPDEKKQGLLSMQAFWLRGCFAEKQLEVDPYL